MRKSISILFFLLSSCAATKAEAEEPSVVKVIGINKDASFYRCTGFVIDRDAVLTSAHCAVADRVMVVNGKKVEKAFIFEGFNLKVVGEKDVAVLFVKDANFNVPRCRLSFKLPKSKFLITKGYPTEELATSYLDLRIADNNVIILNGAAFQGMSGGPVFDSACNIYGILSFTDGVNAAGAAPLNQETINWINSLRRQKEKSENTE